MNFEVFLENSGLSQTTTQQHLKYIKNYEQAFSEKPNFTQGKIIKNLQSMDKSTASQLHYLYALIKYRKFKTIPYDQLYDYMLELSEEKKVKVIESQKVLKNQLQKKEIPNLKELKKIMNEFYADELYLDFAVNFLLINYCVRNLDLIFDVVSNIKETKDTTKNYMVVSNRKCIWIRNAYKTGTTYGQKIITIYNKQFLTSMTKIDKWISETKEVQPLTIQNLGETKICKIVLSSNPTLKQASKISNSRGTSLQELQNSYNISK